MVVKLLPFRNIFHLLYYIFCKILPFFYVKLCHTFRNICDTFVTYLYSYLLQNLYTYILLSE